MNKKQTIVNLWPQKLYKFNAKRAHKPPFGQQPKRLSAKLAHELDGIHQSAHGHEGTPHFRVALAGEPTERTIGCALMVHLAH